MGRRGRAPRTPELKVHGRRDPSLVTDKAFKLFGDFGVYTKEELVARAEIEYESYAKSVNIEAKAMINIAGKQLTRLLSATQPSSLSP